MTIDNLTSQIRFGNTRSGLELTLRDVASYYQREMIDRKRYDVPIRFPV